MSAGAPEMVAVLMTDLVESTAMADRVGPAAAEQLRIEHFGLLRGAVTRAGGREVKNLGDGLMVVFVGAAQSLACAVAIQQALETRNRGSEDPLEVRIGVSVGDATKEDGDYFGEPVVEAARLCSGAQGGQIIVTDLVHRLGGGRDGHSFSPLGGLELKGISEPVQAFVLQWEPAPAVPGIELPERLRGLPPTAYVGRVAERERLSASWAQARQGSLRLMLIGGEAGVGKTRLSTNLAMQAHGDGATVLFGRCDEDLGVPYQPWAEALGFLVKEAPAAVCEAHAERFGADLARLVPALRDRVPDLPPPRESDPETERYLMYAAAAGLLEGAGEAGPLLLILDDLHWADAQTLSLLRHVVAAGAGMHVLVVGTYRDSDLAREHPLTALLADLHREQGVERLKLTGLDVEDVQALMEAAAGHKLDDDGRALATEIQRETAGNPFFTGEVLRHLTESGAIVQAAEGQWRVAGDLTELGLPQSVREVVGRRVGRLGADARTALSAAAVIGRDFDLDLLLAVVELPEARLLDVLEEAVAASLLRESPEVADRFTFAHGLVEHTLYEDLGRSRRARLHKRVAEALEDLCGGEPGERLGELAGHWAAAVVSADRDKAIHYARLAAERALVQLAPDEAARWYHQALELFDQAAGGERSQRCELLIGLGEAQRQVGNGEYRQTLLDAATLAQELGDADRLCRAVLANSRGYFSQAGAVDVARVQALEAAAAALSDADTRRARVLAHLADELHQAGDPSRCRWLAAEAIAIARSSGDTATLADTLGHASSAIYFPDMVEECEQLNQELIELAAALDDPSMSFRVAAGNLVWGLIRGDRARLDSSLATMRAVAASAPEPVFVFQRLMAESCGALARGELDAAESWAVQMFEAGSASGQLDAATVFGAELFNARYAQGRAGELVEQLVRQAGRPTSNSITRAFAALALIESGQREQARALVQTENFADVPWDWMWLLAIFLWADVCSRLGAADRADELYALLSPFADLLAVCGSLVAGSIACALGTLATILEHFEQAEGHFAAAAEIEERFGAPLFLARTHAGWARALIARGRPADLARAGGMLELADQAAERLGGGLVTLEVAECRVALTVMST